MKWFDLISKIDRRIIYLLLTFFVILPLFVPFKIPQNIMPQTQKLFDFIESIQPDDKAIMLSLDYTPQTAPECHPMALAILKHCFARNIPVVGVSYDPQGPGLAVEAFATVVDDINSQAKVREDSVIYGEDYIYLGWKSGRIAALLEMGESIISVYPRDHFRNVVDSFPIMARVRNYKDIAIAIVLAAAAYPDDWVLYPQSRYGVKVGAGLTAVMAPKYYPFLQTGQFSGMVSGMKGAAEYEELVYTKKAIAGRRVASEAVLPLTFAHFVIIFFIIIGNIGYFFERRRKK